LLYDAPEQWSNWRRGVDFGITVALGGSLLVTDDGSNSIWRITYSGQDENSDKR
jgi:hypothetical protein